MKIKGTLICLALLAAGITSASATMRISEDRGGQIGSYLEHFALVRSSGEHIVVDGNCLSACTLLLGVIPRDRICATPRARFGFHAAWMPDAEGQPVTSAMGTEALWRYYPAKVRHWIRRHGGLSRKMIYLQGHDLAAIVPICGAHEQQLQARSERRYAPRPGRYEAASASYRR